MTITGMAKALDVSPMTIYRRLKRNGVNIDDLRDEKTGELTTAGASVIASMFPNASVTTGGQDVPQVATADVFQDATGATGGDDPTTGGVDGQVAAVLRARLEGAQALIEQLTGERDELRRQLAAATAALEREQDDRRQERLMLTDGDGQGRRGWFARLFHR